MGILLFQRFGGRPRCRADKPSPLEIVAAGAVRRIFRQGKQDAAVIGIGALAGTATEAVAGSAVSGPREARVANASHHASSAAKMGPRPSSQKWPLPRLQKRKWRKSARHGRRVSASALPGIRNGTKAASAAATRRNPTSLWASAITCRPFFKAVSQIIEFRLKRAL